MTLNIDKNRDVVVLLGTAGTQNENLATTLTINAPEELDDFEKVIYFYENEDNIIGQDYIEGNTYKLNNSITKYPKVFFYVKFIKDNIEWISETKALIFKENLKIDADIPEEELDIINTIVNILREQIHKVEELEETLQESIRRLEQEIEKVESLDIDIEKKDGVATVTLIKKDGTQKQVEIKDAKINGYNEIEIIAGKNIELEQVEDKLKISAKDYDDGIEELQQEIDNLDTEVERLTDNVNNIASDVSRIDEKVTTIGNDVETNKSEIRELEENQNYLEEHKADKSEIPDVSEFITKSVNNLVNYYRKSETYTKQEVNDLIGAIKTISMKVLPERPAVGESNIIYLIPSKKTEPENIYDEYIYVNNKWELIGTTQIDLSNYYTIEQINTILFDYITSNDLEETLKSYALKTDIPEIKVDNNTVSKNNNNEFQSIGSILKSGGYQNYWKGTKNEYNAITEKDANTLYEVLDDEETALFEVDGNTIEFSNDEILRIPNNIDLMFQSVLYGNGESGYRKYRNGMLEQWGVATSSANGDSEFTMHQAHKDTNFSVFVEPREQGNFFHYAMPSANQKFRTRIQTRDSANIAVRFQWHSWGRWK